MTTRPELVERRRNGLRLILDEAAQEAGLLVAFTDRRGGAGRAPYDTLNLALRVGDDAEAVSQNRRRVARAAGFDLEQLVLARQVHGAAAIDVPAGASGVIGEADVLVTKQRGVVLGILTADCAPVLLASEGGVAVVHAGWRGLVAGAVEQGVSRLAGAVAAWVGPSIHACCYEVGPEVVEAFRGKALPVADRNHVDPGRAAMVALRRAGVERVAMSDVCTSCDLDFFSYRRDGTTGRQGGFIAMMHR